MNDDLRELFREKYIIEKKLNSVKMKIMLSACDKNKDDDSSDKNLESPFKKLVDMLKDIAVGAGLMLGGYKWGYGSQWLSVYGVGVLIMILTGFLICISTFTWFLINLFKVNNIANNKKASVVVVLFAIISIVLACTILNSDVNAVNSEKIKESTCKNIESKSAT